MNRILFRLTAHFVNLFSNALPDGKLSSWLRTLLFRSIGCQISFKSTLRGGGRICGGNLTVCDGTFINRQCYFDLTAAILIEKNCTVGHGVTFITAEHAIGTKESRAGRVTGKSITLRQGAWIGANATILPGVTIGAGAIVGAASLVTKDVSANTVVFGVPAKFQRCLAE